MEDLELGTVEVHAAATDSVEAVDPRIRRTRLLLQQALAGLMERKQFDKISVQDIAEAATINRATFYDHYADKYALLECMVGGRFGELLEQRGVQFDGGCGCGSALRGIVLSVCDYLAAMPKPACELQPHMEPHMEAAVIAVVRRMIMAGIVRHPPTAGVPAPVLASTLSWAIFGAAREWARTKARCPSEEMAEQVMGILAPVFRAAYAD